MHVREFISRDCAEGEPLRKKWVKSRAACTWTRVQSILQPPRTYQLAIGFFDSIMPRVEVAVHYLYLSPTIIISLSLPLYILLTRAFVIRARKMIIKNYSALALARPYTRRHRSAKKAQRQIYNIQTRAGAYIHRHSVRERERERERRGLGS